MKHTFVLSLALGFLTLNVAVAGLSDVAITATRKKLDEEKSRGNNTTTVTKEIVYDVDVQSKTFKPLTNLEVKYMIFFDDAKAGSTEKAAQHSEQGKETIVNLEGNRTYSFQTKSIKLSSESLDAGWYYSNGGSSQARDKVKGIWFRVYSEGKIIGEYANPPTVATKQTWKD